MEHANDPNVSQSTATVAGSSRPGEPLGGAQAGAYAGAVTFDLAHGQVRLSGGADSGRSALVPVSVLRALIGAAGEDAAASAGRALGASLGGRITARGDARAAQLELVVHALAVEVALAGLGTLSLERWGRATVIRLDEIPLAGASADAFLGGVLEGMVGIASHREVRAVPLGRDGTVARFLLANAATAARASALIAGGTPWGDALVRLHAKESR